jgi:transposase
VKREYVNFLAANPLYTTRFAYHVGRRCRTATIKDIAQELKLDWDTVKELDKQYMRAQLQRAGTPAPKVLGFVEGLNNKIRVLQRRAYGLRDEEYLRLKILTCMLPPL